MQDKPSQTAGIANRPPPNIKISARGMRSRYFQEKPSQTAGITNHPPPNNEISACGMRSRHLQEKLYPLPLETLLKWTLSEIDEGRIYGVSDKLFFTPAETDSFRMSRYGRMLETPVGVAAGPHTQLSQNILLSWLMGARYIELKTVQTLDEIEVRKPCIDMAEEGYNCEWSQELRLEDTFREYMNAWIVIHILRHRFGWQRNEQAGFIFNMSVGYDLQGIMNENMQGFLEKMSNCREEIDWAKDRIKSIYPAIGEVDIPGRISDNVTLSTMHGCPPEEIEKIGRYLIAEKGLHTAIKLNPTLLGAAELRDILRKNNWQDIRVPDAAFEPDLKYDQAIELIETLTKCAEGKGVCFGVKLTNTLEVMNDSDSLPESEKMLYLSGKAIHPISINLAHKLQSSFNGKLDISFCAGVDCFNTGDVVKCNLSPVTVCSDLLRPGGYSRLKQYLDYLRIAMTGQNAKSIEEYIVPSGGGEDLAKKGLNNLGCYAQRVLETDDYSRRNLPFHQFKNNKPLSYYDCISAPCVEACAIEQNIPDYLYHTAQGEVGKAFSAIIGDNPLPNISGNVCDRLCQLHCVRMFYDDPVEIREIKRFIATHNEYKTGKVIDQPVSVGIIGAGPSGLSCAYFLASAGVQVEVFEERDMGGGMASGGIPKFRLDDASIEKDISAIRGLGVKFNFGYKINAEIFGNLRAEKDFLYIAVGAKKTKRLGLPGEDINGILDHLSFLADVRNGISIELGEKVVIIGGGNSAVDAARTAIKSAGADGKVTVLYRRTMKEMPVDYEELEVMLAEGVILQELAAPKSFAINDDGTVSIHCVRMKLGSIDYSGRAQPIEITGSDFVINADTVIPAIGQEIDLDFLPGGSLEFEAKSMKTKFAGVFAGGDVVRGASTLIKAVADGKKAALNILELSSEKPDSMLPQRRKSYSQTDYQIKKSHRQYSRIRDILQAEEPGGLQQEKKQLASDEARIEADRCFYCDDYCNICVSVCPNLANISYSNEAAQIDVFNIMRENGAIRFEKSEQLAICQTSQIINIADFCNECGNCTTFCPTSGDPYQDKPRLYLSQEYFDTAIDGFYFQDDTLLSKREGSTASLTFNENRYKYETDMVLAEFNNEDFQPVSAVFKNNFIDRIELGEAVDMYFLYSYLKDLPLIRSTLR